MVNVDEVGVCSTHTMYCANFRILGTGVYFVTTVATETEPTARISAMSVTRLAIDYNRRFSAQ